MKLYEFSYTDKQGMTVVELMATVSEILDNEAEIQGWKADYSFSQSLKPERLSTGETRYHFEVHGQFEAGFGDEESEITSKLDPKVANKRVASPSI